MVNFFGSVSLTIVSHTAPNKQDVDVHAVCTERDNHLMELLAVNIRKSISGEWRTLRVELDIGNQIGKM